MKKEGGQFGRLLSSCGSGSLARALPIGYTVLG